MSLRESILSADDLTRKSVFVAAWNTSVFVRTLSAAEQERISKLTDNIPARIACLCLCDETGARIFADEDAPALAEKSGNALAVVLQTYQDLNKITDEVVEKKRTELKENYLLLFTYRLAERLGMTRGELMARLSTDELGYWLALERIEPRHDPYLISAIEIRYQLAAAGAKTIPEPHKIYPHLGKPAPESIAVVKSKLAVFAAQSQAMANR